MSLTLISTVTVGSGGAASIDFTSIAGTYTDLIVVWSLRSNRASGLDPVKVTFNGATTNYSGRTLIGFGSGAGYSETNIDQYSNPLPYMNVYGGVAANATANTFSNASMVIPNYAGATNKSVSIDWVNEDNATGAWVGINANLWSSTAAITRVTLAPVYGTVWNQYSSASIYGITKGSGGASVSP